MSGETPGSPASGKLNLDPYPRIIGVILLVIGLIFGLVAFYFPIHDALQGAEKISIHSKAIFAFVIFTIMGLAFIILGPIAIRLTYKGAALKGWKKWLVVGLILVVFIAAGELVEHVFKQYLETFGYKF